MASRGTPTSSPALSSPRGSSLDQAIDLDSPRPARDSPAGSFGAAPPRAPSGRFTRGTPGRTDDDEYDPLEEDEDDQFASGPMKMIVVGDVPKQFGGNKPRVKVVVEAESHGLVKVLVLATKDTFLAVHFGDESLPTLRGRANAITVLNNTQGGVRIGELIGPHEFFRRMGALGVDVPRLLKKLPLERAPRPAARARASPAAAAAPSANANGSGHNCALLWACLTGRVRCAGCRGPMRKLVSKFPQSTGFCDDDERPIYMYKGDWYGKCLADVEANRWGNDARCPMLLPTPMSDEVMQEWRDAGSP